ncbi:MAG TPA: family 31 glucosidase [Clostridiales bacterium]|nr:family 31 glucosidase [Clostridiales bacterium]
MSVFYSEGTRLVREYDFEQLWIEPWGANSLRVRVTRLAEMPGYAWSLLEPPPVEPESNPESKPPVGPEIRIEDGCARIRNGKLTALVDYSGKITFLNGQGQILLEEYVRNRKAVTPGPGQVSLAEMTGADLHLDPAFTSSLDIEARELRPIPGGDYEITARFEAAEEKIYGMGQYQQPWLDLKGCRLELAQRNSQASVPFLLSSRGYGFFWHNPAIGEVTFGKNLTEWHARSTKLLDYWITAGDSPAEIESAYSLVTGRAPLMPEYGLGFWQCKLRYQTQAELLEVAREYKRRGLPLSVIVVDFFHWTKQGEWKFDPAYWPDPAGMVRELRDMGVELMVSVWPNVDKTSENYREMVEKGLLVQVDRGIRVNADYLGNTVHFDATRPSARSYVWQKCKTGYYDQGVRIFWLDEAEPEYSAYDFDIYRYYLGPDLQVGNIYPMMYARAFYEGMRAEGQTQVVNLIRCAWAGSQRYGALVWSGDIHSSFRAMRNQFAAGLNMGIAGIPWWTTDIGGFHGGNPDDPAFRECFIRWFEYGCFCPVFRLHGDREPHSPPLGTSGGGLCRSGGANEVWSYGEEAYAICRTYLNLREQLRPYIRSLMLAAHEEGQPVIRPLFYDFPNDAAAWAVEDQMLFGPDVLVAPVMAAGQRSRPVYLPAGAAWRDAATGQAYPGGTTVTTEAPLNRIPVFVRAGALPDFRLP